MSDIKKAIEDKYRGKDFKIRPEVKDAVEKMYRKESERKKFLSTTIGDLTTITILEE